MRRKTYENLSRRVKAYLLRQRRRIGWVAKLLPNRLFDARLWRFTRRGVAAGAAWGVACALAPVPMQSIWAALCCVWRQGNVPIGVAACWLSFPGYQIIAWPVQWWVGAQALRLVGVSSGANIEAVRLMTRHFLTQGSLCFQLPGHLSIVGLAAEFLIGCALTCAGAGWFSQQLVLLLWRPRRTKPFSHI